ncbi:unnamed protein product [Adineta ricciae]|uniref:G-protein coupled receptors family 1 profile domain-containing protein n=2 Tax=Adineta ricciae TaxID=249248 RepID=A0A814JT53_ADIRI|nr:unnamed protein product [Adineta ricciae]CAF1601928.1 unnamed protein product [Adineta ricciae]
MLNWFSRISTWLFIEMLATLILVILNLIIPMLMIFSSYRNIVNFYFSSVALASSLINTLYLFYLVQSLRSKVLLDINCRAIYYLQASCIVVLAYTVTAMHANFVLSLFPSSTKTQRTCLQSCGATLRRFFRRFCFCLVLCVWSFSFTSTIPLLYTIDSNEKAPKPVYCPGTTQISYLEEWFDRNRFTQTVVFYLIPLLISSFLTLVAVLKILYDCFQYIFLRIKMSRCSPCRRRYVSYQEQSDSTPYSATLLQTLGLADGGDAQDNVNITSADDTTTSPLRNSSFQACGRWISTTFLRLLLVLSCCLLACIYPIAMRFYLIYFSVLVPLVFAVLNYSFGQLTPNQEQQQQQEQRQQQNRQTQAQPSITVENHHADATNSAARSSIATYSSLNLNISKSPATVTPPIITDRDEQFELRSSLIGNFSTENEETSTYRSGSSTPISAQNNRPTSGQNKRKYFANHLYENTRSLLAKSNV